MRGMLGLGLLALTACCASGSEEPEPIEIALEDVQLPPELERKLE